MFKNLFAILVFGFNVVSVYSANPINNVECFNDETSFKLINEGNLRNGATARIADLQGTFPFGGVWLWMLSNDEGYLNSKTKYKTTEGGTLTVLKQVSMGRGGCGRGSCSNELKKSITAYYVSSNGSEFIYECNKIFN